ncbi:hypothetical protein GE21DRAFT_1289323 [Neurospora crassa]|nr:hypothetical protein GE21DRAFT_1289323 [Neurospora crassa]
MVRNSISPPPPIHFTHLPLLVVDRFGRYLSHHIQVHWDHLVSILTNIPSACSQNHHHGHHNIIFVQAF